MSSVGAALPPLHLRASLHETIWGGHHLAQYAGKRLPPGSLIGESWETELQNGVVNPPYQGRSLAELVAELGEPLLGSQAMAVFGPRFPLLAKFIDAQDKLSVQVHPNDEYARQHENGKLGKTEAWYILHADPGAAIIHGMERAVTREEVQQAIANVTLEALVHQEPVQAGDVIFVPAGTVHAIGPGIILYELQEYSDVTYRLYDYGRLTTQGKPRELHVERALDVMDYQPTELHKVRPLTVTSPGGDAGDTSRCLAACRYFVLEELSFGRGHQGATRPTSCQILSLLDGTCTLSAAHTERLELRQGDTVVLPAQFGSYTLAGQARLIRSYVPTPDDDILRRFWSAQ